jgi:hypothetical protein
MLSHGRQSFLEKVDGLRVGFVLLHKSARFFFEEVAGTIAQRFSLGSENIAAKS